jgi:hypothetical protein
MVVAWFAGLATASNSVLLSIIGFLLLAAAAVSAAKIDSKARP